MKRGCLLLALALGLAGCVTPPPAEPIAQMHSLPGVPAGPVRADQVTSQNAHKMSQALADELDRETQREITTQGSRSASSKTNQ